MKRLAIGLILYFCFLLITLPASFMDRMAAHFSKGAIRLANAGGTFWHGSATLGISGQACGFLSWKVSPMELLLARLHIRFDSGMEILASPSGIEMKHVSLDLPASVLALLSRQMKSIQPQGNIRISAGDFLFSGRSRGQISAIWENASSPFSRVNPLGSYRITITGAGSAFEIGLETLSGPLDLSGKGSWSERKGIQFSGTGQSGNEGVLELLRLTGSSIGGEKYALRLF